MWKCFKKKKKNQREAHHIEFSDLKAALGFLSTFGTNIKSMSAVVCTAQRALGNIAVRIFHQM